MGPLQAAGQAPVLPGRQSHWPEGAREAVVGMVVALGPLVLPPGHQAGLAGVPPGHGAGGRGAQGDEPAPAFLGDDLGLVGVGQHVLLSAAPAPPVLPPLVAPALPAPGLEGRAHLVLAVAAAVNGPGQLLAGGLGGLQVGQHRREAGGQQLDGEAAGPVGRGRGAALGPEGPHRLRQGARVRYGH